MVFLKAEIYSTQFSTSKFRVVGHLLQLLHDNLLIEVPARQHLPKHSSFFHFRDRLVYNFRTNLQISSRPKIVKFRLRNRFNRRHLDLVRRVTKRVVDALLCDICEGRHLHEFQFRVLVDVESFSNSICGDCFWSL